MRQARPRADAEAERLNGGLPEPRIAPDADANTLSAAYAETLERARAFTIL